MVKESQKMQTLFGVISVVFVIALGLSFGKINNLQNDMLTMQSRYENRISDLQDQIGSIYHNVDVRLKKEASLFSKVESTRGSFDETSRKTAVTISVTPKDITDDMSMSVTADGETVDFVRKGDVFQATVNVGMFVDYEQYPFVRMKTAEDIKTEYLEDVDIFYLYMEHLPSLYAEITHAEYKDRKLVMNRDITIESKAVSTVQFDSYTMLTVVNGKEVERTDITAEVKAANGFYNGSLNKAYDVALGDTVEVYVEAVDSIGYIHKALAYSWYEPEDGSVAEAVCVGESIYDAQGKLLWGEKQSEEYGF